MKNIISKKLKNDLSLLLVPKIGMESVGLIVNVGVGSRYEKTDEVGMTHFVEHLMFDGTKRRPNSLEISKEIDALGADINAHPTEEYTSYHIKVASEHLDKVVDIIADMLTESTFLDSEIEKEKRVVIEEIKMRSDIPSSYIYQVFDQALFAGTPLARYTGGEPKAIKKFNRQSVLEFYQRYYTAENSFICLAGNFSGRSEEELTNLIEQKFNLPAKNQRIETQKLKLKPKKLEFVAKDSHQTNLAIGFLGPSYGDEDRLATKLLAIILGGNMSSRMFTEIREKQGLAYDVRTFQSAGSDIGSIVTVAGVADEKAEIALKEIINQYQEIKNTLTVEELEKAKTYLSGQMKLLFEDSYELGNWYLTQYFYLSKIELLDETFEKIAKIELADVKRVAEKYLDFKKMSVGVIAKNSLREKIAKVIDKF